MKILRTMFTWALLLVAAQVMADKVKVLTVDDVNVVPGKQCELVVNMDYDTNETIQGCNFSVYLPKGITPSTENVYDEELGEYVDMITGRFGEAAPRALERETAADETAFNRYISLKQDGGYLVMVFDFGSFASFRSTHGELARINLDVASTFSKSAIGEIKQISVTNKNSQSLDLGNIADVEFNFILGSVPDPDPDPVTDPVTALTVDDVTIEPGKKCELVINMDYDTEETVTAVQFNLYLPEGISPDIDEDGEWEGEIGEFLPRNIRKRGVQYIEREDGGWVIVVWDGNYTDQTPFNSTHGMLMRLSLNVASNAKTSIGEIKNIAIINGSISNNNINDVKFNFVKEGDEPLIINDTDISKLPNTVYFSKTEVKSGAEETLSFNMKNTAPIRGFQFNLYLPDGVTAVKSAKGKIQASLSNGRRPYDDEHTLAVTEQEDGSLLFLCGSQYDETFTGNDGEVMTLKVKVADDMEDGDYPIILKNIKLTQTDISKYYEVAEVKSTLTVSSYMLGDINGDQKVDVSDYIGVANRILGNTPQGFIEKAGDVDESGTIDVSDYIGVANIILTGNIHGKAASRTMKANTDVSAKDNVLYVEPFKAEADNQVVMSLKMKNTAEIRGFQFNLYLPEGVTVAKSSKGKILTQLSADRLPDEDEHTLAAQEQADGSVLFLCGSQYDECFTGNDGEIATITIDIASDISNGDHAILLKNIKLTETDISKYYETAEVETTITIGGKNGDKWGDVNNDGVVDVADIATIINIMATNARLQQTEMTDEE